MSVLDLFGEFLEKQDVLSKLTESEKLHGYGYSDIHVIAAIKKIDHANVTKISNYMRMTRGAISKITKRLIKAGCITPYLEPENKKEVYFQLTPKGEGLNAEHDKRHELWKKRDTIFLNGYSAEEIEFISRFMKEYNAYLEMQIRELGGKKNAD
ncbi:MAG: winged helix DNA-binding protein [Blautia sp.]|nr:winged helix DNA-binding protein [Blautia sp.]